MNKNFENWKKDWKLAPYLFEKNEIEQLKLKLKNFSIDTVGYCSYENRFAKSGGLAMVAAKILPYLKEINKIPNVLLITPFHSKIIDQSKLNSTGLSFLVPFGRSKIKVEILEYIYQYDEPNKGNLKEYYLKAEGFFNAQNRLNDPYLFIENNVSQNDRVIRENALFFCKAVPMAIQRLGLRENIVFHLQEWQTALIALTSKQAMLNGILESCGTVQTLHNPYDAFIPFRKLGNIIDKLRVKKLSDNFDNGLTAYQLGLQLIDAPITTVSDNFAKEFTTDILQTKHFVPHLQKIFKRTGVYGVNNGLFHDYPSEFQNLDKITVERIKQVKFKYRKTLLQVLNDYNPPERFGKLTYQGGSISNLPDNIPIFLMSGRLDYSQKGYDIFLHAIERFEQDEIKVVLTPMPLKDSHLNLFRQIANKCRGNLTVLPIKMQKGYFELQIGSSFGVMPSIYEPFGAATEYMVKGTLNISRDTGGLVDQIDNEQCGLLFRENSKYYNLTNIKQFFIFRNSPKIRDKNDWVQSMIDQLYETMRKAIDLYQNYRDEYYQLILSGFQKTKSFDWAVSAEKYYAVYKKIREGF